MKVKWVEYAPGRWKATPWPGFILRVINWGGRNPWNGYIKGFGFNYSFSTGRYRRDREVCMRDVEERAKLYAVCVYTASVGLCRSLGVEIDDDE